MVTRDLEGLVLLEVGRSGAEGCAWEDLLAVLRLEENQEHLAIEAVRRLVQAGRVVERERRLCAIEDAALVAGVYDGSTRDTTMTVEWPRSLAGRRLEVSWRHRRGARHGDRVLARPLNSRGRRRTGSTSASVLRVLERSGDDMVGRLRRIEGRFRFEPFLDEDRDSVEGLDLVGETRTWRDDEWVLARIIRRGGWTPAGSAAAQRSSDRLHVTGSLGRLGEPGVDAQIVAVANRIPTTFPNSVIAEVREISGAGAMAASRQDLTHLPTVTIDGETARDFDDAITVTRVPDGGFRLWVHIADVSHFVAPGSALDQEAMRRGTSVYLQETVVPMLPARLSDDLCSLRPRENRCAVSIRMDFDSSGRRTSMQCCESLIRSDGRLTYDQVADFLDDASERPAEFGRADSDVGEMLENAAGLMRLLNRKRVEEGSLEFDLPSSSLRFDARARIAGAAAVRLASHRLIEEFMLEANTAVAELLDAAQKEWEIADDGGSDDTAQNEKSLFLFRVHNGLSRDGMAEIEKVFTISDATTPQERIAGVSRLSSTLEGSQLRLLAQLTLRALERATYEPARGPHRALGKSHYCHFTSPIRRYPDLVMHRRLKEVLGLVSRAGSVVETEGRRLGPKLVARECSRTERRAEKAERELRRWRVLRHLSSRVDSIHRGLVTGVGKPGLFVQLTRLGVDGLVSLESLLDDHYLLGEDGVSYVGRRTGRTFRMGDELRVRVAEVDEERRWLQLTVVGMDGSLFRRQDTRAARK